MTADQSLDPKASDHKIPGLVVRLRRNFQQIRAIPERLRLDEVNAMLGSIGITFVAVELKRKHRIKSTP